MEHEQSAQQAQTSSPEAFRRASEYPPHLVAALLAVFCRMGFHPGDMLLRLLLLQLQRSEPGDIPVATALQLLQSLAVLQHDEGAYRLSALQQRSPCFAGSSTACCMALDVAVLQHMASWHAAAQCCSVSLVLAGDPAAAMLHAVLETSDSMPQQELQVTMECLQTLREQQT